MVREKCLIHVHVLFECANWFECAMRFLWDINKYKYELSLCVYYALFRQFAFITLSPRAAKIIVCFNSHQLDSPNVCSKYCLSVKQVGS